MCDITSRDRLLYSKRRNKFVYFLFISGQSVFFVNRSVQAVSRVIHAYQDRHRCKNDDLFKYEVEKVIRPKAALNAPFFEDFSKFSNFKIFGAFKAP